MSKVPPPPLSLLPKKEKGEEEEEEDSDAESTPSNDNDGARYFTRSVATQTSPRRVSSSDLAPVTTTKASEGKVSAGSLAQNHTRALLSIHANLSDLLPPPPAPNGSPLGASISELQSYLEKLPQERQTALGVRKAVRRKAGAMVVEDAVADLKAEIRGVKGVLMSARNFPSGVMAR